MRSIQSHITDETPEIFFPQKPKMNTNAGIMQINITALKIFRVNILAFGD